MEMRDDNPTPTGYFLAIGAVVGATLLMPSFPLFFTTLGPLLLLVLTPFLLIYATCYRQERRRIARENSKEQIRKMRSAVDLIPGASGSQPVEDDLRHV